MKRSLAAFWLTSVAWTALFAVQECPPPIPLRTVAQVNALSDSDFAENIPFSISGLVIAASECAFFLQTKDGNCQFHTPTNTPSVGEIVQVTGRTKLDRFDSAPILRATDWQVVGTGPVPPPVDIQLCDVFSGKYDYRLVRLKGLVIDVCEDEVDHLWRHLVMYADGHYLPIACITGTNDFSRLPDAYIAVTGFCQPRSTGRRRYLGYRLNTSGKSIEIIKPAPTDPFAAPPLGNLRSASPETVAGMSRRTVRGRVLAVLENEVLVRTACGITHDIKLADSVDLPMPGDEVLAAGMPETDLYHINLSHARLKVLGQARHASDEIHDVTADEILFDRTGHRQIEARYHGKTVRLRGIVRTWSSSGQTELNLECGPHIVPVNLYAVCGRLPDIAVGSEVEVTGICRMDADIWHPNRIFPQIRGFTVIPRSPDDVRILSRPSWWTPSRLVGAILSLSAITLVLLYWNRMLTGLVRRKGRALLKSEIMQNEAVLRVEERSRIAAELHDSLAQDLTAISYRLISAQNACNTDPLKARNHLAVAATMLQSSRTELRRCIWDLRVNALSETTFDEAVRKTLQQVAEMTKTTVRIDVPRSSVSDATAHAILCSVRELTTNAFRHGQARHVEISGRADGERLTFVIVDDGNGFDIEAKPGPDEGHFGLDNITERIAKIGGSFTIRSQRNHGTTAVITIPLRKRD